ncbi:hypothetical protein RUND412_001086 [Rhizina undulata]
MMSKYFERKAQERKFPAFGSHWGKYAGPDVPSRQAPLSQDSKSLPVEAKSNSSQPRSDKVTRVPVEDERIGKTLIWARRTPKDRSKITNPNSDPRSLWKHAAPKAVSLGGEPAAEELDEVDGGHDSKHREPKKLRASFSDSTWAAAGKGQGQNRAIPEFSVEAVAHEPFSFQQEKWLLVHITGHYPLGNEMIPWDTVSNKYKSHFTVGRTTDSLKRKWEEMVKRGVSIDCYEPKKFMRIRRAPPQGHHHTTSHDFEDLSSDPSADTGDQSTGNDIKPSQRTRRLYTSEEVKWLLEWIRVNTAPGEKRNWAKCDLAFRKKFKYSRGTVALMNKYENLERDGMTSFTPAGKMGMSTSSNKRAGPTTFAGASSFTTPPNKGTGIPWSREEEAWLFAYCQNNFVRGRITFDWNQVVDDFNNRWGFKRTTWALVHKWHKIKGLDFDLTEMSWDKDDDEEVDGNEDE